MNLYRLLQAQILCAAGSDTILQVQTPMEIPCYKLTAALSYKKLLRNDISDRPLREGHNLYTDTKHINYKDKCRNKES